MNVLTICPCCSTPMLHHYGNHREYWFCRNCWQEMLDIEVAKKPQQFNQIANLSISLKTFHHPESMRLTPH